ncbi:alpha/beta hydrolase [Saccharothrix longispora]|uniref:Pimeloyl-ACP methyl ester carboxylesterase n=1 Tax=Saccharothrix longispora TaxID=33920 RepID=A0ABU1PWJ7_9PSEU|nr:alpha/beta hydrolase [Saccharothrix longispora]MDR6595020.1 pimeloyl-ACP methyl ester carboxylesterase [Saccharothrix longispora]
MQLRFRALALTVAAGTALSGLVGTGPAAAQDAQQAQGATPIQWSTCADDVLAEIPAAERAKVSCANHPVPLDHARPRGPKITVALMKRPAEDQANRIGSLFINPGGPGGAGLIYSAYGGSFFQPEVMKRFDLIGFDPRGVGRSTPLRCFQTLEEADEVFGRMSAIPITRTEIRDTMAATVDYTDACARNAGPLLQHMSTEAVARDLDLFRQGVGDRQLTFVGFSYGTLLGATYANIFPSKSRALVLDGNVDPKLRTTNGPEYDRQRAKGGFELALDAFLDRCDAEGDKCAYSEGDPRAKFDEVRDHLRTEPVALPSGEVVTLSGYVGRVASDLYAPTRFKALAAWLQSVYAVLHPGAATFSAQEQAALLPPLNNRRGLADIRAGITADTPYEYDDSYYGVNCTDKPFLRVPELFPVLAAKWERESPTFGRYQAASDLLTCPTWPVPRPDRWAGPWNKRTPNPVVVVGNYYDPATQYEFSKRMTAQLGNARLVSVDAFGHCILGDSAGVDTLVTDYLVNLKAPADGQVFQPNAQPF